MNKYDFWLRDHNAAFFGPVGYQPIYEFARPTHEQFRQDCCELVACYPEQRRENFDQLALDTIWRAVRTFCDQSEVIRDADVPAEILDGTMPPVFQGVHRRIFEGGYAQRVVYLAGTGVTSGQYLLWHRDRLHLNRDYRVDDGGGILSIRLQVLADCVNTLNPELAAAIATLMAPAAAGDPPAIPPIAAKKMHERLASRNAKIIQERRRLDALGVRNWVKPLQKAVPEASDLSRQTLINIINSNK